MDPHRPLSGDERRRLLAACRVYLVVGEASSGGPWEDAVARALSSGVVGVVQLREKDVDDATFLARAGTLGRLARAAGALLGVSCHDAAEVAAAPALGADYAGLGPCFPTGTKALARRPRGAALVGEALPGARVPVFPIGGITPDNVAALAAAGATRVAVGAGVLRAADPAAAARAIAAALATS